METTIYGLTTEMQTWLNVSPETLKKAEESKITNKNNSAFSKLVRQWERGDFDEDPDRVLQWIEAILEKEGK